MNCLVFKIKKGSCKMFIAIFKNPNWHLQNASFVQPTTIPNQRHFIYYHKGQRKAAQSPIYEAAICKSLTHFLEKWMKTNDCQKTLGDTFFFIDSSALALSQMWRGLLSYWCSSGIKLSKSNKCSQPGLVGEWERKHTMPLSFWPPS